jgi:hypothetical protein
MRRFKTREHRTLHHPARGTIGGLPVMRDNRRRPAASDQPPPARRNLTPIPSVPSYGPVPVVVAVAQQQPAPRNKRAESTETNGRTGQIQ